MTLSRRINCAIVKNSLKEREEEMIKELKEEDEKYTLEQKKIKLDNNKLWNKNFILLFQGELISDFGDTIYSLALSFWVLSITGSTALMGIISATAVIPRIFISPFAGTFVDRHNRKNILIAVNIFCGLATLILGILTTINYIKIWTLVAVAIALGVSGCFFSPALYSLLPELVPKDRIINANSIFLSANSINSIISKMIGGYILQFFGAPLLFIFNGISYLISAIAELFIKIPQSVKSNNEVTFYQDMILGMKYIKNLKGLRNLYIIIALLNFCGAMSTMLMLPLFKTNSNLGIGLYGVAMGVQATGMFVAFFVLTMIKIKTKIKFYVFIISGIVTGVVMMGVSMCSNFYLISILLFINGFSVASTNSLIQASMQSSVDKKMRSKVHAFKRTLSASLSPIAMMIGGVIAEFISINSIIFINYLAIFILFIMISFISSIKEFINS